MGQALRILVFLAIGLNASAVRAEVAGTWKGFYEAPTGLGVLELSFSQQRTQWKAVCKFPELDGENTFQIRDLNVSETNLSFNVVVASRQMRFNGKLGVDSIEGTYEMFREAQSTYVGEWGVRRALVASASTTGTAPSVNRTNILRQLPRADRKRADFPSPTGPFVVGRTTFYWQDATRRETLATDPVAKRELMVTLWYPATRLQGLRTAIYFPNYRVIAG
jgi:hypothetical protein